MGVRAVSPVVGIVCLLAVTVLLATAVGVATTQITSPSSTTVATFEATAESDGTVTIVHRGGDSIDVAALELRVRIGGEPLERQPPVPFFSARGFESGPTGPFNSAMAGQWRAGEPASFRIAETNAPTPSAGDTVTIRVLVDGNGVARLETTV